MLDNMKEITINKIDDIKKDNKTIVLIWTEGCKACEETKEYFSSIESKYDQFTFYKLKFSDEVLPFYIKYIPKEPIFVQVTNEEGTLLAFDQENKPIMTWKVDEQGNTLFQTPFKFPNFMVFLKSCIEENNEHGFIGNIAGLNKEHLEFVLNQMSDKMVANG